MGNKQENRDFVLELVSKAKKGDKSAFDQLYNHYIIPIFRYVYFKVERKEDAEDLTQVVFLKAWKALDSFQQTSNPFSSWLYKITRNTVIDYYKKKKEIALDKPIEELRQIVDPVKTIEQKEKQKTLYQTIKQLSEDQQEVIVFKFIEGLSNKEIAGLMNRSEEAVRALQYRAIKALKEKLKNKLL